MEPVNNLEKEKKKIGIITFHRAHNYGAFLQAYALQIYLQKNGFETEIIDYRCKAIEEEYFFFPSKNVLKGHKVINKIIIYMWSLMLYGKRKRRYDAFKRDIEENMFLSENVGSYDSTAWSKYDAIIFGSDQIWNVNITKGMDSVFWGHIAYGGSRVSYAASFGDEYSIIEKQIDIVEKLLSKFNRVGVRESSAKVLLNKMGIDAVVDIDPTLLLCRDDWYKRVNGINIRMHRPYVLLYRMKFSDQALQIAKKIAKDYGMELVEIASSVKINNVFAISHLSPIEFVAYLKNANYIVTSSFHGTAFAMNFHKPFYAVYDNKSDKSKRIEDLLKAGCLEERYISSINEITKKELDFEAFDNWINLNRNNLCNDLEEILLQKDDE